MLREALLRGDAAKDLLHFVSVKPGDYFEIQPGVPHAIGGGVTLLEPQRILTGQAGKTYRMWDWGRRYDKDGRLDMQSGDARPLHVDESLPLVDPEHQVGEAFVATMRREPRVINLAGGISVREFPANPYYKTALAIVPAGAELNLRIEDGYSAMLMLEGQLDANDVKLAQGQTALVPFAAAPLSMVASERSEIAFVAPAGASLQFTSRSSR
jgi:mannose-6-phosphate isomerase